jgi:hypothetical protein
VLDAPPYAHLLAGRGPAAGGPADGQSGDGGGGSKGGGGSGGVRVRTGLVITARGDSWKYAQPVVVCVHVLRIGVISSLPVEILHVGAEEAFPPGTQRLLESYGDVVVADMLPRLAPGVHAYAATLRSFAAKPYALLAASCELCVLADSNLIFLQPPEALLFAHHGARGGGGDGAGGGGGDGATASGGGGGGDGGDRRALLSDGAPSESEMAGGVLLFNDYVPSFRTLDPLYTYTHLGVQSLELVRAMAGKEIDSSLVAVDKRLGMRALLATAALNRLRAHTYRHMHGDKDSWALGALLAGIARPVSRRTEVGWLVRAEEAPAALGAGQQQQQEEEQQQRGETVWGHVQFVDGTPISLNWQPHYARGFVDFEEAAAQGSHAGLRFGDAEAPAQAEAHGRRVAAAEGSLHCCALFSDSLKGARALGTLAASPGHATPSCDYTHNNLRTTTSTRHYR